MPYQVEISLRYGSEEGLLCGWLERSLDRVSDHPKTENVTIQLGELTVVFSQAQFVFFEPLRNATEVVVMLSLPFFEYNDVN